MIMKTKRDHPRSRAAPAASPPSTPAAAQEHGHETPVPPTQKWSFAGPFGKFDQAQLQRGFKVYKEVCSPAIR